MTPAEVLKFAEKHQVKIVDFKFVDLLGMWQHFSIPVEELVEEGQSFEAEIISGIEDTPDADAAEVHTKQVPADDVPPEYEQKGPEDRG